MEQEGCCAGVLGNDESIRDAVRAAYGQVATAREGAASEGDAAALRDTSKRHAAALGYDAAALAAVPEDANLGLGCGNPTALAALQPGEVVLDLGSGAGLDALIAAPKVGPTGRVIGVDMTPEMLERARTHAVQAGFARTVEFREGVIEALPVASGTVDVVISNCVINLSPDKPLVFREAFRVLKPGGRIAVSDLLLTEPLPPDIAAMASAFIACVGGAMLERDYFAAIEAAGFVELRSTRTPAWTLFEATLQDPLVQQVLESLGKERVEAVARTVWSYKIEAKKP